jgi:hypothetical protein
MRRSLYFSIAAFAFFLCREIIGYGAVSLPAPSGLVELVFPFSGVFQTAIFWATIPGAVMLTAIALALATLIYRKLFGIKRLDKTGDDK